MEDFPLSFYQEAPRELGVPISSLSYTQNYSPQLQVALRSPNTRSLTTPGRYPGSLQHGWSGKGALPENSFLNTEKKFKNTYKGLFTYFGKFILLVEFAKWPAVDSWQHSLLTQVLLKAGFGQAGHSSLGNNFLASDSQCHNILWQILKVQVARKYKQNTETMVLFELINVLTLFFLPPSTLPSFETQLQVCREHSHSTENIFTKPFTSNTAMFISPSCCKKCFFFFKCTTVFVQSLFYTPQLMISEIPWRDNVNMHFIIPIIRNTAN